MLSHLTASLLLSWRPCFFLACLPGHAVTSGRAAQRSTSERARCLLLIRRERRNATISHGDKPWHPTRQQQGDSADQEIHQSAAIQNLLAINCLKGARDWPTGLQAVEEQALAAELLLQPAPLPSGQACDKVHLMHSSLPSPAHQFPEPGYHDYASCISEQTFETQE